MALSRDDPGRLGERVIFQVERDDVSLADGSGGRDLRWRDLGPVVWGELTFGRSVEVSDAGRLQASSLAQLRVRHSSFSRDIRPETHRCVIDGEVYQIRSNRRDATRAWRLMDVEAGVGT